MIRPGEPWSGLGRALAASLLLHLVLLWPTAPSSRHQDPAVPLTAVLRPSAAPVLPSMPAMVPKPALTPRPEKAEKPTPSDDFAVAGAEHRVTTSNHSTIASPVRSAADAGTPAASTSSADSAIPSALPASQGVDAEGLRGYRLALAREARRYKRYPARAIEVGWSGTVELRVSVRADGIAQGPELARSSGHVDLDEAALDMLRQALPATPVPAILRGREFAVSLPVVFELPE